MADPIDPERIALESLVSIQRMGNTLGVEAQKRFRRMFGELVGALVRIDPMGAVHEATKLRRVERFLEEAEAIAGPEFAAWGKELRLDLARVGAGQSEVGARYLSLIAKGAGVEVTTQGLGVNYFKRLLDTHPFQGETLAGWISRQEAATMRRLGQTLRVAAVNGETIDQAVRRVRGRSVGGGRYRGGIMHTTTREASTIVRTGINEISNQAHMALYEENSDVTKVYEYVATLDSRTTPICQSLDGQTFRYDDPNRKVPPQHPNCRSTIIPVVDWEGLGMKTPKPGTRASADGQVSASTNYEGWLRGKSEPEVAEILGPSRAKLFKSGKVNLRDLVRNDGTRVPLEQLRG